MRRLALLTLAVTLLAGCGQKGNLYLAEEEREAVVTTSEAADTPAQPGQQDDDARQRRN